MTNDVSGRVGDPIPLVSGSAVGTEGQLRVYNHQVGKGLLPMPIPQDQSYRRKRQIYCCRLRAHKIGW